MYAWSMLPASYRTDPLTTTDKPMNTDEFEARLRELISAARDKEVPLERAYDVRSPKADDRDYQVEITEVVKNTDSSMFFNE